MLYVCVSGVMDVVIYVCKGAIWACMRCLCLCICWVLGWVL